MIPSATPFNECYAEFHQLQALDALGYQNAKQQTGRVIAVEHRRDPSVPFCKRAPGLSMLSPIQTTRCHLR
jgi:hypothetical protein